jgi:hypothetical protein
MFAKLVVGYGDLSAVSEAAGYGPVVASARLRID